MTGIKQLHGVLHVQIDREEGTLFIEKQENDGVAIDLNIHQLMHLLNEFTEEEWGIEEIYGVKDDI
jgi:hypothetical protein